MQLFEGNRYPSPLRRRKQRQTPFRIREDPQCYYAENLRKSVDNDIRYRQSPAQQRCYKEILGTNMCIRFSCDDHVTALCKTSIDSNYYQIQIKLIYQAKNQSPSSLISLLYNNEIMTTGYSSHLIVSDDMVKTKQKALHEEMRRNLEFEQKMVN